MTFGRLLMNARKERKISKLELAKWMKVEPSVISYLESGKELPTFTDIYVLAHILCVSADYFEASDEALEAINAL